MSGLTSFGDRLRPSYGIRATALILVVAAALFLGIPHEGLQRAESADAYLAAICLLAVAARFPGPALCLLFAFTPLQLPLLGFVYHHGLPANFVKDLGYIKDAMTGGILLAAVRSLQDKRLHLDRLDWAALAYVGIASFYLILPSVIHGSLGGQPFQVRLNAWRLDCLFPLLMLGARRVDFTNKWLNAARITVIAIAVLMLVFSLVEVVDPTRYNRILDADLGYPAYQFFVLRSQPPANANYVVRNSIAGVNFIRAGSLFGDSSQLGFWIVIPLALCLERLTARRVSGPAIAGLTACLITLVLTETRSTVLAGAVAILAGLVLAFRTNAHGRYRFVALLVAAAIVVVPISAGSAIRSRVTDSFSSTSQDNLDHRFATFAAVNQVIVLPEGKGLGSNPATGARYHTDIGESTENSYLQVGIELGAAGMFAFVAMFIFLLNALLAEARRRRPTSQYAGAMWLAGCGLFAGGMFLQIWTLFPVTLTFWGLAGASIGTRGGDSHHTRLSGHAALTE